MNKATIPTPEELIIFWKKGWPDYVVRPADDYSPLTSIMLECCKVSGEDPGTDKGKARIALAITAIAIFCYNHDDYGKKNIRYINQALPRVIHEMQYAKRSDKLQKQIDAFNDYYDRDKRRAQENEKLSREGSEASLKWYKENWTKEDQIEYEAWKANGYK